jgi:hypothetical protein
LVLLTIPHDSQEQQEKRWAEYYPLAVGNVWKYSITKENGTQRVRYVVWKVINSSGDPASPIFAVWPTPADSDDTGMQLQFSREGIRELSGDFFVLKFPLQKGNKWSVSGHDRVFVVVSEGEPCLGGNRKFDVCAVVQDDDHKAKLRIITTYAYGVGPVSYEYYKMVGTEFEPKATQTLNLISCSVR